MSTPIAVDQTTCCLKLPNYSVALLFTICRAVALSCQPCLVAAMLCSQASLDSCVWVPLVPQWLSPLHPTHHTWRYGANTRCFVVISWNQHVTYGVWLPHGCLTIERPTTCSMHHRALPRGGESQMSCTRALQNYMGVHHASISHMCVQDVALPVSPPRQSAQ